MRKLMVAAAIFSALVPKGANAWTEVSWIANETLMHMEDALVIMPLTVRDLEAEFNKTPTGKAKGDSVDIRTNGEYQGRDFDADGGSIVIQDIRSSKRTLKIEKHYDISVEVTAKEKRLDLESFSEQVIQPAAYELAELVDGYLGSKALEFQGLYASDDLFGNAADMAAARKAGTLQQLSPTGRFCLVGLDLEAKLLGATYFNTYNNRGTDGSTVFREGSMGRAMAMDFFASINFPETTTHTAGDSDGIITNYAAANNALIGTSLLPVDGGSGSVDIKAGDRLQVAGMRRPVIAAADFAADNGNIQLTNPITEVVPDGAAVTVIGGGNSITYQGAIFDDRSICMASPMLDPADDKPSFVVSNNGVSVRVVQGYNMTSKKSTLSMDLIIGATAHDTRRGTLLANY